MQIKIWFTDFWEIFNKYDNYFTNILSRHFNIKVTPDDPDFLIFSFGNKDYFNYKNCIRIFYTGENIRPDFTICDYSISFDYEYYEGRNFRFPLYALLGDVNKLLIPKDPQKILSEKTKFCNFVYSNNKVTERNQFFQLLSKYKRIDSGGTLFNNIGKKINNKHDFIKDYKFTIAFENSSYPGYTSEKIFDAMLVNSVPIYWGNPNIDTDFNTSSFINVHEYASFEEVIERIIEVDKNDDLYLEYLKQPYFKDNKLNEYVQEDKLLDFFAKIIKERKLNREYAFIPNNIKISIIIPVYNNEKYLEKCLKSIVDQDFDDYEIICVNDGSIDNSLTILQNYQKHYKRIKVINQENRGPGGARNTGINYAKGKYIVFIDSDDFLLPKMLRSVFDQAEKYETDILAFNARNSDNNSFVPEDYSIDKNIVTGKYYYWHYFRVINQFPSSSSVIYLFNRQFLLHNNLQYLSNYFHEDEHFVVRALYKAKKLHFINKIFYKRVLNSDSIMHTTCLKNSKDMVIVCRKLYSFLNENHCDEPLFYRKLFQLYMAAIKYSIDGKFTSKRKEFITEEDFNIMKQCVYNSSSFLNYQLAKTSFSLFHILGIKQKPWIIYKTISTLTKLYYHYLIKRKNNGL